MVKSFYTLLLKPLADFVLALTLLVLLFPIGFFTSILLYISNNGSVFYMQPRPGRYGEIFTLIKFKTMNDAVDEDGYLLSDTVRLTPIGRKVRELSLDELPQLINILKGEMSFIGPRPLLKSYLPYYSEEEHRRHDVKPGITGLAQISGRNQLYWDKRMEKDIEYVNTISLKTDLVILFKTIIKVIKREDIEVDPYSKMVDFITFKKMQN
ncbi:sugar transferase [Flagellimonas hymeniacidonis]|uniref:Sugar transferase n=1 Tax=Flagellimonas hymeniacidonis TaxID=2603628 RepID=A0A5C8V342_9FLAO|nr:sugar transferase [Flagellimonas hymeniacidonis]TXN35980.1 sugar transferase [Flagellimonas hymeniacidonis]